MSDGREGFEERMAHVGAGLSLEIDEQGVAILEFDQPDQEHNRFTAELLERFVGLMGEIRSRAEDGEIRGLVLSSGKDGSFLAGMDVSTIAEVRTASAATSGARQGQLAFAALADLPIVTVAAINGTCLGGGTEMALACDYRLAADSSDVEIGLPEVQLGIIPGFGGTQRLPRRISLERALPMILTGKAATADRARRIGLVDAVVPARLLVREASEWAATRTRPGAPPPAPEDRPLVRRIRRWLLEGNPLGRALVFRQAAARVRKTAGPHYPAPQSAIEAVRRGLTADLDEGLRIEASLIGPLIVSDVARNLMGLFFLRQAARRRDDTGRQTARRIGVIGAGIMGGGIAQLAAYQGVSVRMRDIALPPLQQAMEVAWRRFEDRRRAGKLSRGQAARALGLISPTLRLDGLRRADLVIEAIVENLEIKHRVLTDVERAISPDTVLATNTSSLTVGALAEPLSDPGRFVGLHFFNPVHRMPLVEVVRGPATRHEAVARAAAFAVQMGKVPVIVGDAPGFFVNRVLGPYLNEAMLLLQEGNSIESIDRALVAFGMPMGPLRLLDEVGLDVAGKVAGELGTVFGDRIPTARAGALLQEAGRLGRKGGNGFYRYPAGGRPSPDPEVSTIVGVQAGAAAPEEEIVDRCVLALLNEACRTLDEGVIATAQAGDLALVLGTGFAPFRGGIFRYADARGAVAIVERLEQLAAAHGDRFRPAGSLFRQAADDATFYPEDWPRKIDALDDEEG